MSVKRVTVLELDAVVKFVDGLEKLAAQHGLVLDSNSTIFVTDIENDDSGIGISAKTDENTYRFTGKYEVTFG